MMEPYVDYELTEGQIDELKVKNLTYKIVKYIRENNVEPGRETLRSMYDATEDEIEVFRRYKYATERIELHVEPDLNKITDKRCFTIKALESGYIEWTLKNGESLQYSINNEPWETMDNGTTIDVYENDEVRFKGNITRFYESDYGSRYTPLVSCRYKVFGNIMSLSTSISDVEPYFDYDPYEYNMPANAYYFFFGRGINGINNGYSTLVDASGLTLPIMNLSGGYGCYSQMFYTCTSLLYPPELPATEIEESCYSNMFGNCWSLVNTPSILPATTLVDRCYEGMFNTCQQIKDTPTLPATTIAASAYSWMFSYCQSLTGTTSLPATVMENLCYTGMFNYCTSLVNPPSLPATTLAERCYENMFSDCTSLTTAPSLPATILASECYRSMFSYCYNLTSAPALPATALTNYCYSYMFYDCHNLTSAPALPATTLETGCYSNMFSYCKLTTAPTLPATTLKYSCYEGMFLFCSNLTTAPELPATTLANSCYYYMFKGCSSLTTAPELPATTLANGCYNNMFSDCSSLNYIKAMFTTTPSNTYTNSWVYGVANSGTFIKNSSATWNVTGSNGVPNGWTIQTASS